MILALGAETADLNHLVVGLKAVQGSAVVDGPFDPGIIQLGNPLTL